MQRAGARFLKGELKLSHRTKPTKGLGDRGEGMAIGAKGWRNMG